MPDSSRADRAANVGVSRRRFLRGTIAATALTPFVRTSSSPQAASSPTESSRTFERKIKLGVVGNGGRGCWIAQLFKKHGGFEMHAVADYFPEVAEQCGAGLGVPPERRFSGLSGFKKVFESGIEAVALETPPWFFQQHVPAAIDAGLHVYMAKPVAVDVPGCLQIAAAGKQATLKKQVLLVDYQMPTDPGNQEVLKRVRAEGFGRICQVGTIGVYPGFADPPKTDTIESRLRNLIWVNDVAIGCDYIGNFDIHALDAALWALGRVPIVANGASSICRRDPHGDSKDVCSVVFEYADGLIHNHFGQGIPNQRKGELSCRIEGEKGYAVLNYWEKAVFRSFDDAYSADVTDLYDQGAARNIASFYEKIAGADFKNETVQRAVDGALICILGREAAARRARLTMVELLKENRKLELDLRGLKV